MEDITRLRNQLSPLRMIQPSLCLNENDGGTGHTHLAHGLSLSERLSIEFFIGLFNGATRFTVHKLMRYLKKYFPSYIDTIETMGNFMKYGIRYITLAGLVARSITLNEEVTANLIPSSMLYFSSRLLLADAMTGDNDQPYPIRYRFGEEGIIHVFLNLVLLLSTMVPTLYNSNDPNNPIQLMLESLLHILASIIMEILLNDLENYGGLLSLVILYSTGQKLIKLFLAMGVDVNATNEHGVTPLHWAICYDRQEIISQLLTAGADVNAMNKYGESSLHWAVFYGDLKSIQQLLAAGANVDIITHLGTSLQFAVQHQTSLEIKNSL